MSLCILTNDSALYSSAPPDRLQHLRSMPLVANLSAVSPPQRADFERAYNQLEHEFNSLLVLCPAPVLLGGMEAAQQAASSHGGLMQITVLDTGQIGPGLGMLAQLAALQAAAGAGIAETADSVRAAIPGLFTLISPGKNAQDESSQPIFSLEDGRLAPYKKSRTRRRLVEDLLEFLEEFERPSQLAFFHGSASRLRSHTLRESVNRCFPGIQLSDLTLNLPLTALFGSQTVGLTILEPPVGAAHLHGA